MKKIFALTTLIALFSTVFFIGCKDGEQTPTEKAKSDVRVKSVIGKAVVAREGAAKLIRLRKRMILRSSDVVRTDAGAKATLVLGNRGVVMINENSNIRMSNLLADNTKLDINDGGVKLALKKIKGDRKFNLETPTAVAGVRGTTFMIDVKTSKERAFPYSAKLESENQRDTSRIMVFTGAVAVVDPENKRPEKKISRLRMANISEGVAFDDIKIEKITLKMIEEFREIVEVDEAKRLKGEAVEQMRRIEASTDVDAIIEAPDMGAPKLKSRRLSDMDEKIDNRGITNEKKRREIRSKNRMKIEEGKRSRQLKDEVDF